MENSLLIGFLVMALTSLLPLAGVFIRVGGLVRTVTELEEKVQKLENDLQSKSSISEDWRETLMLRISEMSASIRVIEAKLEFTATHSQQRSQK